MIFLINSSDTFLGFKKAIELVKNEYIHLNFSKTQAVLEFFSSNFLFNKIDNIILDDLNFDKKFFIENDFQKILQRINHFPGIVVLLNCDEKFDATKFFDCKFEKIIDIPKINYRNINKIIEENLIEYQLNYNQEIINYLAMILAHDYNIIENEIIKLSLLNKSRITIKDIDHVCSFSNNDSVFKIVDYYLTKKNAQAFELMNFFISNEMNIEQLFSMLVTQLFKIKVYCMHYKKHHSIEQLMADFKLNKYQLTSSKSFIIHESIETINEILNKLSSIDYESKKNFKDRKQLLTLFILQSYSDL